MRGVCEREREREREEEEEKERKKGIEEVFCWRKQGGIMIWAKVLTTNTAKCVSLFSTLGARGGRFIRPLN